MWGTAFASAARKRSLLRGGMIEKESWSFEMRWQWQVPWLGFQKVCESGITTLETSMNFVEVSFNRLSDKKLEVLKENSGDISLSGNAKGWKTHCKRKELQSCWPGSQTWPKKVQPGSASDVDLLVLLIAFWQRFKANHMTKTWIKMWCCGILACKSLPNKCRFDVQNCERPELISNKWMGRASNISN